MALDIWRCTQCSHRYQHPRVTFEKACELYSDDKTASDIYTQPLQKDIDRTKYQYGLSLIKAIDPIGNKRIMDIGCGAGVFLEEAHQGGWEICVGIDANSRYSSIYRESKGIQFIQSSFEKLNPNVLGADYDCITMWNVLEHLYDLHGIIAEIKKMLKPNGLLLIMVPNVESLATRLIRDKSATFNWKHVSHFSPRSLLDLMFAHELKCVHLETAITEIDNIKSYMAGEFPYHGHGDPDHLFDFITPEYLHNNLLGSRIIAIFKK
jgi:2-polyprenyl-3-methyl-5-hydroxy-6-metoxy-1,4-benzoquinol methylase